MCLFPVQQYLIFFESGNFLPFCLIHQFVYTMSYMVQMKGLVFFPHPYFCIAEINRTNLN